MKECFSKSIAALASVVLLGAVPAAAQESFPNRAIRVVVGFTPGGNTDLIARVISAGIAPILGVPVVVDNKPGANGNIAAQFVINSKPDGYTVLVNASSVVLDVALGKKPPFDLFKDLKPVAILSTAPLMLIVHPSVPARNIQEFVIYLKANPNKLNYASAGIGNMTHLTTAMLLAGTGTSATHVPYAGGSEAITSVIANQTQFYMAGVTLAQKYAQEKRLTAMAVTTAKRSSIVPDVPTFNESVMPGYDASIWNGMLAPAGVPDAIIERLNKAVNAAQQDKTVRAAFASQSVDPIPSTPAEYKALLNAELKRWTDTVKAAGIKPEV